MRVSLQRSELPKMTITTDFNSDHDERNQMAMENKDMAGETPDLSNGSVANASSSPGLSLNSFSPSATLAKMGSSFKNFGKKVKNLYKKIKNPIARLTGRMSKDSVSARESVAKDSWALGLMSNSQLHENALGYSGGIETETPDWQDPSLIGSPTSRYVATLAVAQESPKWMSDVEELKAAAFHKLATSPKKFINAIASGNGEEYLGEKVVKYRQQRGDFGNLDKKQFQEKVEEFTHGIHSVGHAWIRLEKYAGDGGGKLQTRYSYGMWPAQYWDFSIKGDDVDKSVGGYAGFAEPGPGFIRHPDVVHEEDEHKAYYSKDTSKEKFSAALKKAQKLRDSPPPYVLLGYNCTSFAKEIFELAGGSYPGSGLLPSIGYTPGNLYHAIMKEYEKDKNSGASTSDNNAEVTEEVFDRTDERTAKFLGVDTSVGSTGTGTTTSVQTSSTVSLPALSRNDYLRAFMISEMEVREASNSIYQLLSPGDETLIAMNGTLKGAVSRTVLDIRTLNQIDSLAELIFLADYVGFEIESVINDFVDLLPNSRVTKLAKTYLRALNRGGLSGSVGSGAGTSVSSSTFEVSVTRPEDIKTEDLQPEDKDSDVGGSGTELGNSVSLGPIEDSLTEDKDSDVGGFGDDSGYTITFNQIEDQLTEDKDSDVGGFDNVLDEDRSTNQEFDEKDFDSDDSEDSSNGFVPISNTDLVEVVKELDEKLGSSWGLGISVGSLEKAIEYGLVETSGLNELSTTARMYLAQATGESIEEVNRLCADAK